MPVLIWNDLYLFQKHPIIFVILSSTLCVYIFVINLSDAYCSEPANICCTSLIIFISTYSNHLVIYKSIIIVFFLYYITPRPNHSDKNWKILVKHHCHHHYNHSQLQYHCYNFIHRPHQKLIYNHNHFLIVLFCFNKQKFIIKVITTPQNYIVCLLNKAVNLTYPRITWII